MPMIFRSLDEVDYIREKLRPDLERQFLEKGYVVLFWADAGWVRFFTKEPVVYPTDLKKLKVFTWVGDNNQVEIMKAAGYHPDPVENWRHRRRAHHTLLRSLWAVLWPRFTHAGAELGPSSRRRGNYRKDVGHVFSGGPKNNARRRPTGRRGG